MRELRAASGDPEAKRMDCFHSPQRRSSKLSRATPWRRLQLLRGISRSTLA